MVYFLKHFPVAQKIGEFTFRLCLLLHEKICYRWARVGRKVPRGVLMDAFCDKFIEGDMGMAATRLFVSMNFITAHKKRKNLNTSPPPT